MSKFLNNIVPGNGTAVRVEVTSVKGSYILMDPSKTILPLGVGRLKVAHEVRKGGVGATMIRTSIPWTDALGVTRESTFHMVATNEVEALLKDIAVAGPVNGNGDINNTQIGAFYSAQRITMALSVSNADDVSGVPHAMDSDPTHDASRLVGTDATARMGNVFVRAALGLEPISDGSANLNGAANYVYLPQA